MHLKQWNKINKQYAKRIIQNNTTLLYLYFYLYFKFNFYIEFSGFRSKNKRKFNIVKWKRKLNVFIVMYKDAESIYIYYIFLD